MRMMAQEYPKIETLYTRDPDHFVTDVIRCPEMKQIKDWLVTEKVDGTNIRVVVHPGGVSAGFVAAGDIIPTVVEFKGRTDRAQVPTFLLAELERLFPPERLDGVFDAEGVVLFGEGYGAKIQKGGGNYRTGVSFRLFDVLVDGRWWLDWENVCNIAKKLDIRTVPVLGEPWELTEIAAQVQAGMHSRVAFLEGPGNSQVMAEGIVARTDPYLFDKRGRPLRFKLKTGDFHG